jgi:hypothetical protein
MAALLKKNVSVRVVCGTKELKVTGSYYLTDDPATMRISSTDNLDDTLKRFVTLYKNTSTQFSITPGDPSRGVPPAKWIVVPRGGPLGKKTDIKGNSNSTDPTYLAAVRREFQEETGSDIPESYFYQDPAAVDKTAFCLNIEPAGMAILDANYAIVKPATEIWEWEWVASTGSCPGALVPASDITLTDIAQRVKFIKSQLALQSTSSSVVDLGKFEVPKESASAVKASSQSEAIALLRAKIAELKAQGKSSAKYEGKLANVEKNPDAYKTVDLAGGRRTIRRKKSKQPKRKGTSKKGVRRSH